MVACDLVLPHFSQAAAKEWHSRSIPAHQYISGYIKIHVSWNLHHDTSRYTEIQNHDTCILDARIMAGFGNNFAPHQHIAGQAWHGLSALFQRVPIMPRFVLARGRCLEHNWGRCPTHVPHTTYTLENLAGPHASIRRVLKRSSRDNPFPNRSLRTNFGLGRAPQCRLPLDMQRVGASREGVRALVGRTVWGMGKVLDGADLQLPRHNIESFKNFLTWMVIDADRARSVESVMRTACAMMVKLGVSL